MRAFQSQAIARNPTRVDFGICGAVYTSVDPRTCSMRERLCCACVCAARPRSCKKHAHNQRRYKHLWAPCHAHASRSASVGVPPVRVVIAGAVVVLSPAGAIISRSQQPLHPASPPHRRPLCACRPLVQTPDGAPRLHLQLSSPISHLPSLISHLSSLAPVVWPPAVVVSRRTTLIRPLAVSLAASLPVAVVAAAVVVVASAPPVAASLPGLSREALLAARALFCAVPRRCSAHPEASLRRISRRGILAHHLAAWYLGASRLSE